MKTVNDNQQKRLELLSKNKANKGIEDGRIVKYSKIRKPFFQLCSRLQRKYKKELKKDFKTQTSFLKDLGLAMINAELRPCEEVDEETHDVKVKIKRYEEDEPKATVNSLLYYKDKHSISDRAYADLNRKCHLEIPTIYKLRNRRQELDNLFQIHDNSMGVFVSLKEKLTFRIGCYFDRKYGQYIDNPGFTEFKDPIIHVKLSADGTNIGRSLKLLNFTFTILNEGDKARKAQGNYTIGIYEIENENHESLKESFAEIIKEMEDLNELEVKTRKVKIVFYYGADWKNLALILGLQGANSKFPCVWCKCLKEDFHKLDQDWSIIDRKYGARSHEEREAILNYNPSENNKNEILTYNYHRPAIFKNLIPNNRYMIDMLHLFLRISDTLFNLLVKDCSLADNLDMSTITKFDLTKYKHMNSFQHFLNEKCNVKFSFCWISETRRLTWRDLVGPEKNRFFENFNLAEIIPDHEKFDSVERLWNNFYEIIRGVKDIRYDACELKEKTREWLELYLTVYSKTTVTPYMHAFVSHLPEFVHMYKDINSFNCQGIEKLNDLTTNQFFRGTNKSETALHQILKRRNRMEFLTAFVSEGDDDGEYFEKS